MQQYILPIHAAIFTPTHAAMYVKIHTTNIEMFYPEEWQSWVQLWLCQQQATCGRNNQHVLLHRCIGLITRKKHSLSCQENTLFAVKVTTHLNNRVIQMWRKHMCKRKRGPYVHNNTPHLDSELTQPSDSLDYAVRSTLSGLTEDRYRFGWHASKAP